jgi:ABC-type amino acid transport system permease subunit
MVENSPGSGGQHLVTTHTIEVRSKVMPVDQTFYLVTKDQVDSYAEKGDLFDLFLALCTLAGGGATGIIVALLQGSVDPVAEARLIVAAWAFGITTLLFLILCVVFGWRRRERLKDLFRSRLPTAGEGTDAESISS